MLTMTKLSNQGVFKVLSLFFCYSNAEMFKSLEFDIQSAGQQIINIPDLTGINNFSSLIMKSPAALGNNAKLIPSFVKNYTQGEILPPYYLLTDSIDRVTENFSNISYVNNQRLLTSFLYTNGQLKWKYLTDGWVDSSPAIASDGTIYVGSSDKNLYAINPNGSLKWKYLTDDRISSSSSIASDGTIYVGSVRILYAITPNGSLKWSYFIGYDYYINSSPSTATDGTIYMGSNYKSSYSSSLYAINPNGSLKWTYLTGDGIYSSPSIASDGTIYVGSSDKNLYAINPNGSLKWKYLTGGQIYSSPSTVRDNGTIYVCSDDNNLYAINPNGSLKWKYLTDGWVYFHFYSSPSVANDGTIYVGSFYNKLYAINSDGSLKWTYLADGAIKSSPSIASDGTVYVGSFDKNLYAINSDGSLKWKYLTDGQIYSSPSIAADGSIYVGSYDNNLYAISSNNYVSIPPWPKFRQNNLNNGVQASSRNSLQLFDIRYLTIKGFSNDTAKIIIDFYEYSHILTMYIQIIALPFSSILNKIGNNIKISDNVSTSIYQRSAVATLTNGNFVVAWDTDQFNNSFDVYCKVYSNINKAYPNVNNNMVLSEFRVNTYTNNDQRDPSITALPNANFVITWDSFGQDGFGVGVYGQIYSSMGMRIGNEFQVNTYINYNQHNSAITTLSNGNFVVVWESEDQDNSGSEIYGQMYTNAGSKIGAEVRINNYIIKDQRKPTIAALNEGKFISTWTSQEQNGNSDGLYGQIYSGYWEKIGSEFQVNTYTKSAINSCISSLPNGNFIIVWDGNGQNNLSFGIYASIYSIAGTKIIPDFEVSNNCTSCLSPVVTTLSNNNFVVAWSDPHEVYGQGQRNMIYVKVYNDKGITINSGSLVDEENVFFINQVFPAISALSNENFVVCWSRMLTRIMNFPPYAELSYEVRSQMFNVIAYSTTISSAVYSAPSYSSSYYPKNSQPVLASPIDSQSSKNSISGQSFSITSNSVIPSPQISPASPKRSPSQSPAVSSSLQSRAEGVESSPSVSPSSSSSVSPYSILSSSSPKSSSSPAVFTNSSSSSSKDKEESSSPSPNRGSLSSSSAYTNKPLLVNFIASGISLFNLAKNNINSLWYGENNNDRDNCLKNHEEQSKSSHSRLRYV